MSFCVSQTTEELFKSRVSHYKQEDVDKYAAQILNMLPLIQPVMPKILEGRSRANGSAASPERPPDTRREMDDMLQMS